MSANVRIDTGGLTAFGLRLREMLASFPVHEEEFLATGAEAVKVKAQSNAAADPSVASTIRVVPLPAREGKQAVAVGAGYSGSGNPGLLPLLLEGRKFSHWEHPVFGNDSVLVTQMSKPYLAPALHDTTDELESIANDAIEEQLETELSGTFS